MSRHELIRGCSLQQRTATHCNTLQLTATSTPCNWRKTCLRCRATNSFEVAHCNNALQHTATHCNGNTLQPAHDVTHMWCHERIRGRSLQQRAATHCSALQHTATHCNSLQLQHTATGARRVSHVAPRTHSRSLTATTHCNTLQHTATYCNTLQHTATGSRPVSHVAPPTHLRLLDKFLESQLYSHFI